MAYSPGKSPSKRKSESVIGYVHELSPIKKNKSRTIEYHSLTLQTSSTQHREALLYSTQKSKFLEESLETRTPVKFQNITYTADGKKIVINDMTLVTTPKPSKYDFQYADFAQHEDTTPVPIFDVLNKHNQWDTVTIKGKIAQIKDTTIVGSKKLRLCQALIADNTATMPLDIWENNIATFKLGSIYIVAPVQVRVWSRTKKLSTIVKTTVTETTDETLSDISLVSSKLDENEPDLATVT
ncbi:uncharacterized protein LOC110051885 [Orbicella faveolata]|uniref:uncharacterized protein LOC110051885 n=1 Tax=Orbicella faveolata TaxID=48498 RepID=UPI0009E1ACCE|nr:uncharacterized protein LOC110051885 [Orbicella faveolata]